MRIVTVLLLAGWTVVITACGGDKTPVVPAPPPLPNYTGIWQGTYTITSCVQNGSIALANICGDFGPGRNLSFQLNLIQVGNQIIQGTFHLGTLAFTVVPATLTSSGAVTVSGSTALETLTILTTWSLQTPITGTLAMVWSSAGLTGQVNIQANIGAVVKTGTSDAISATPQSLIDLLGAITADR